MEIIVVPFIIKKESISWKMKNARGTVILFPVTLQPASLVKKKEVLSALKKCLN